ADEVLHRARSRPGQGAAHTSQYTADDCGLGDVCRTWLRPLPGDRPSAGRTGRSRIPASLVATRPGLPRCAIDGAAYNCAAFASAQRQTRNGRSRVTTQTADTGAAQKQ